MDAQELRSLQEAYMEVYQEQELDEAFHPVYGRGGEQRRTQTPLQGLGKHARATDKKKLHNIPKGGTTISDRDPHGDRLGTGEYDRGKGNKAKRRAASLKKEEIDIYDIILSHLLDEGYAETQEQAEVIMVNMSEEWRNSIMEREQDEPGESDKNPEVRSHNRAVGYRVKPRRPRREDDPRYGTVRDRGGNWKY